MVEVLQHGTTASYNYSNHYHIPIRIRSGYVYIGTFLIGKVFFALKRTSHVFVKAIKHKRSTKILRTINSKEMYFKSDSVIFSNGEWIVASQASTGLCSQSLHYGNGFFEGIRSYKTDCGAAVFEARAHDDRLLYGANLMGISCPYTADQLVALTYELLDKNKLQDAYIRPFFITDADMGLRTTTDSAVILQCWEWGKYMGDKLLCIKTSRFERPNPRSCFVDAKVTGHYVNSILATNEAKDAGYK